MPSECASIGVSPGPTDHMYNAGSVGHLGPHRIGRCPGASSRKHLVGSHLGGTRHNASDS